MDFKNENPFIVFFWVFWLPLSWARFVSYCRIFWKYYSTNKWSQVFKERIYFHVMIIYGNVFIFSEEPRIIYGVHTTKERRLVQPTAALTPSRGLLIAPTQRYTFFFQYTAGTWVFPLVVLDTHPFWLVEWKCFHLTETMTERNHLFSSEMWISPFYLTWRKPTSSSLSTMDDTITIIVPIPTYILGKYIYLFIVYWNWNIYLYFQPTAWYKSGQVSQTAQAPLLDGPDKLRPWMLPVLYVSRMLPVMAPSWKELVDNITES